MSGWDSKDGGLGMAFLWATETPQAEKEMTRGTKKKEICKLWVTEKVRRK